MTKRSLVLLTVLVAFAVFAAAGALYTAQEAQKQLRTAAVESNHFVRPHAPILGRIDAPVTIVEFFDPSCEACRAFYPYVKQILATYPNEVRLVLRYAPFHKGSDEAVRILEAARIQRKFEPVLEALLKTQPAWAVHGAPNLGVAWQAAEAAGLNVEQARRDMMRAEVDQVLKQDIADIKSVKVNRTPTFFVNSKPLTSFGPGPLNDLVRSEVEEARGKAASQ